MHVCTCVYVCMYVCMYMCASLSLPSLCEYVYVEIHVCTCIVCLHVCVYVCYLSLPVCVWYVKSQSSLLFKPLPEITQRVPRSRFSLVGSSLSLSLFKIVWWFSLFTLMEPTAFSLWLPRSARSVDPFSFSSVLLACPLSFLCLLPFCSGFLREEFRCYRLSLVLQRVC